MALVAHDEEVKRWRLLFIFPVAVLIWSLARIACQPKSEPLAFLERYPLRTLMVAEASTPPSGPPLLCRVYAIPGSLDEIQRRLDQDAKEHGMPSVLLNDHRTWMNTARTLTVEVLEKMPPILSEPGPPGTKGYVVAYEPEQVTVIDRLWPVWLRLRYR